jgi:peroxiredoxin
MFSTRLRLATLILASIAILVTGCTGSQNFRPADGAPGAGTPPVGPRLADVAPDFTLTSLDGAKVRLSDLRGHPVVVNFWATWCPPCKEEMPYFEQVGRKYRDEGVVFLGISEEDASAIRDFVTKGGYDWTFLLDPESKAYNGYQVTGFPESYFVDKNGVLRDKVIGPMTVDMLEMRLARIR